MNKKEQLPVLANQPPTMTSREIAELTGKEHKNVLADIRDMLAALSLGTADFSAVYLSENGQYYDCFKLPERECLILVSGYSIAMRAKIIDRWRELEAQTAQPVIDLNNPEHLRGLLGSYAEKAIALQGQLDHAIKTKAQIGDKKTATAMATASKHSREAAKLRDQLGFSARHATILQVEDAMQGDFNFLPLRNWCKAHEVTPEVVPDKRYPKGVKAWPAGAWGAVYGVDLVELFGEVA